MLRILCEAYQKKVPEVARKHGVSKQAMYVWRLRDETLANDDVRGLRQLELEYWRLKKPAADPTLGVA